jgi:hypothetical protein
VKIFVSWSKDISHSVAVYLQVFLKDFFKSKSLDIYVSSERIVAGETWFDNIKEAIKESSLCIIVMTDENEYSRWVYFEAGAIAFNTKSTNIIPILLTADSLDGGSPLNSYQCVKATKEGFRKLLLTIKKVGRLTGVTSEEFESRLEAYFPKFESEIQGILVKSKSNQRINTLSFGDIFPKKVHSVKEGSVFVGAPMASIGNDIDYAVHRDGMINIIDAIEICCDRVECYWAGKNIAREKDFHGEQTALSIDLSELKSSSACVFVYMEKIVSSVIVEIGYAIALNKKIIIFCRNKDDLPYLLRYSNAQISNLSIFECKNYKDIADLIEKDGNAILGAL